MPKIPQTNQTFRPFWKTTDDSIRLYLGHVIDVLRQLPEESVHCVITSPPYWALRSYLAEDHENKHQEIGSERTPAEYVQTMVDVFREVYRVLRYDGTLWLNLGDTYANSGSCGGASPVGQRDYRETDKDRQTSMGRTKQTYDGITTGNLVGVPWQVAKALQADGWILRSDIIWAKPSPMPESCTNRPTKSHEYLFLLAKQPSGYYYDAEAIREEAVVGRSILPNGNPRTGRKATSSAMWRSVGDGREAVERGVNTEGSWNDPSSGRNKWTVWSVDDERALLEWLVENHQGVLNEYLEESGNKTDIWRISSEGYGGNHFATFPSRLVEPCILAGTSEHGCCSECQAPYKRIIDKQPLTRERPHEYTKRTGEEGTGNSCANTVAGVSVKTLGWKPTCKCGDELAEIGYEPGIIPCTVLDPFVGSGTTCVVALAHGRHSIGIDLSKDYLTHNAVVRIEGALMSRPGMAHLTGHKPIVFKGGKSL